MTKRTLLYILAMAAAALAATSCKDEFFTIEGTLTDGGTQNIRALYVTDYETLQSEWVTMTDGHFEFTGINYDWTVVYLINNKKDVIARAAVKNGDDITINGSMADPHHIIVEGNDANEEWSQFMVQNAALYSSPDRTALNKAIEEYINANPDRISSTLLLLNDYANLQNTTSVDTLFKQIGIDARPSGLVNNYFALSQQLDNEKSNKNIPSLMLYSSQDTITTILTSRYKATLLYFWNEKDSRKNIISKLKQLYKKHEEGGRLQVIDIMMSPDSTGWKKTLDGDSTEWKHYWAPGGTLNRNLANIGINTIPYYIVTTSIGKQLYRGNSIDEAIATAEKQMQEGAATGKKK